MSEYGDEPFYDDEPAVGEGYEGAVRGIVQETLREELGPLVEAAEAGYGRGGESTDWDAIEARWQAEDEQREQEAWEARRDEEAQTDVLNMVVEESGKAGLSTVEEQAEVFWAAESLMGDPDFAREHRHDQPPARVRAAIAEAARLVGPPPEGENELDFASRWVRRRELAARLEGKEEE